MPSLCKLMSSLSNNLLFAISQPIIQKTEYIRCLDPCFDDQRSLKYHSRSDNVRPRQDNTHSADNNLILDVFTCIIADWFRGALGKCFTAVSLFQCFITSTFSPTLNFNGDFTFSVPGKYRW